MASPHSSAPPAADYSALRSRLFLLMHIVLWPRIGLAARSRENSMTGCVQSTAENPERDIQSADGIFPILAYGPPEFAQPYSAANRGRTNKRHPTCERPDRCHVASPNRS